MTKIWNQRQERGLKSREFGVWSLKVFNAL